MAYTDAAIHTTSSNKKIKKYPILIKQAPTSRHNTEQTDVSLSIILTRDRVNIAIRVCFKLKL